MIIRVRSNVGMARLNFDSPEATVNDLITAIAAHYSLSQKSVKLANNLDGSSPITCGDLKDTLNSRGIKHGDVIYLVEKIEKETVAKSSIDAGGNVISAGTHFQIAETTNPSALGNGNNWPETAVPPNRPPLVSSTVPVAALKRDIQRDQRLPEGSEANAQTALPASHPPTQPQFNISDYQFDDEDNYRAPDSVKRERLLGSPSPARFRSEWEPSHGIESRFIGTDGRRGRPGDTITGFAPFSDDPSPVARGVEPKIDEEMLAAMRSAGINEYEIHLMMQRLRDEALAEELQRRNGPSPREAARSLEIEPTFDSLDDDVLSIRSAARVTGQSADEIMSAIEARLQGYRERGGGGYVPSAFSSSSSASLSPYEKHLRKIREQRAAVAVRTRPGDEAAAPEAVVAAPSPRSPKALSLIELKRELEDFETRGAGSSSSSRNCVSTSASSRIGTRSDAAAARTVARRQRIGLDSEKPSNAPVISVTASASVPSAVARSTGRQEREAGGDNAVPRPRPRPSSTIDDPDDQMLMLAIQNSLQDTRPPGRPPPPRTDAFSDGFLSTGATTATDQPRRSTALGPRSTPSVDAINLEYLDEEEMLAQAIRESLRK